MVDGSFAEEVRPWGLPTNHASRSRQVLPARKLVGVPISVTDEQAAAFTVGGQTSCAMVRRAGIHKGDEVLVTAGTSDTLVAALTRNVTLIMNCLGTTDDLLRALEMQRTGALRVVVDTVLAGHGPGVARAFLSRTFLSRTFCDRTRVGKVVVSYG
jgi:hypothetical protein